MAEATVIYAATGDAFARLEENNGTWSVSLTLAGSGAQCLAIDPARAERLYIGCRGRGLWRSDDGGRRWHDLGLPGADVFSVAVSPADGTVYAGCEPSMLFRSGDEGRSWEELGALRELPSAPTWSFPPRPWTSHVRWIAPSPHEGDRLLVGIELGGLMLSEDGGRTWQDHRPGAQPDVHAIAWHPRDPGRAYEAGGGGSAWSFDAGRTWSPADAGRDRHYTWALAVHPDDPDCWFVSASPGPMHAHRAGRAQAVIYRWRSSSGSWEAVVDGLPEPLNAMPYALVPDGDTVYAGLSDGRLFVGPNRGQAWRQLEVEGDGLTRIAALALGALD